MDAIKNAMSGSKDSKTTQSSSSGGQDYLDKGFDAASKKAGHDFDPKTDEKITDGARSAFEKGTGKNVPDKVSN